MAAHGQYLPFDPPFAADGATIGGTVASGVSGPGRYRYGGVRDFLIGVRVVDGEGRVIRSGGKVVKNAAGFLLHHGMVGSLGRFGVLTEVTFKVFPQPEARRTVTVECESVDGAFRRGSPGRTAPVRLRGDRLRRARASVDQDWQDVPPSSTPARRGWPLCWGQAVRRVRRSPTQGQAVRRVRRCTTHGLSAASCVKVAGLINSWQKLRAHVTSATFMCAGSVAWLVTDRLPELADALREAELTGLVIRGPQAGERIGHFRYNEFEERIRRVLDPQDKFSAASDSSR